MLEVNSWSSRLALAKVDAASLLCFRPRMQRGQHIVAVAAVITRGPEILSLRRAATNEAGAGLWETLSGRIEQGEAVEYEVIPIR